VGKAVQPMDRVWAAPGEGRRLQPHCGMSLCSATPPHANTPRRSFRCAARHQWDPKRSRAIGTEAQQRASRVRPAGLLCVIGGLLFTRLCLRAALVRRRHRVAVGRECAGRRCEARSEVVGDGAVRIQAKGWAVHATWSAISPWPTQGRRGDPKHPHDGRGWRGTADQHRQVRPHPTEHDQHRLPQPQPIRLNPPPGWVGGISSRSVRPVWL
jgi:hypothetical protein